MTNPDSLPAQCQTSGTPQPRPLRIGAITLSNNLILAPMAGVTDRPFRELCRGLGAGLAVSEMVSADTSLWGNRKSLRRLDHRGETRPIAAQILGNEPALMAEAARINLDLGADIIDINMGCPAKKVCRKAAGSALLRDERLVGRILAAVVAAVSAPVTLKIRTGWSPEERNAPAIARIAWESGIAALAVHGRTRACGFSGQAEFETLRAIRQTVRKWGYRLTRAGRFRAELHGRRCYHDRTGSPGTPLDLPGNIPPLGDRHPLTQPLIGLDPGYTDRASACPP